MICVQTEERNQLCNTIVLNSDTLFREDNVEFDETTLEISQTIETLIIGDSMVRALQDRACEPRVLCYPVPECRIGSYISEQQEVSHVEVFSYFNKQLN